MKSVRSLTLGWFVGLAMGAVTSTAAAQTSAGVGYGPFWQRPVYIGGDAGWAVPTGDLGRAFDAGWDLGANVAWPFTHHHGAWLQADFDYASASMNPTTLVAYGATAGYSSLTSATLNVVLNKRDYLGSFTPYLRLGGGMYWRYVALDNYAGNGYCNAFVGFCGTYGTAAPTRTRTQLAPGGDAGGGVRYPVRPFLLFVEARYNTVATRHGNTTFIPVVLGIEW